MPHGRIEAERVRELSAVDEPGDQSLARRIVEGRCRPGPEGEARALGRWPSQASYSVWSEGLWQAVLKTRHPLNPNWAVRLGCDVARFGNLGFSPPEWTDALDQARQLIAASLPVGEVADSAAINPVGEKT